MVEIAKALSLNARLIIMDEPTSSLTLSETTRLLELVCELGEQGVSIIYISHRLGEIDQCADRVVVLRDGKNAGELTHDEATHDRLVSLMVGREIKNFYVPPEAKKAPPAFSKCAMSVRPVIPAQISFLRRRARGNSRLCRAGRGRALGNRQGHCRPRPFAREGNFPGWRRNSHPCATGRH